MITKKKGDQGFATTERPIKIVNQLLFLPNMDEFACSRLCAESLRAFFSRQGEANGPNIFFDFINTQVSLPLEFA
jgi:hypothetical protein